MRAEGGAGRERGRMTPLAAGALDRASAAADHGEYVIITTTPSTGPILWPKLLIFQHINSVEYCRF